MNNPHFGISLYDPQTPNEWGGPTPVLPGGVVLNCPVRDILEADDPNAALADAIVRVLSPEEAAKAHVQRDNAQCCARCGKALDVSSCTGCGARFRDTGYARVTNVDLPQTLREAFEARGHTFTR